MRSTYLVPGLIALAAAVPLAAMDSTTVGPRALGMGGAGVAAADDGAAQFYNPAIYGFFGRRDPDGKRLGCDPDDLGRKTWGVGIIDASAGYEARGRLADYVQRLDGVDLERLSQLGSVAPQADDLKTAMLGLGLIGNFDPGRDVVVANANAGAMGIRIGRFGIGFRAYSQALLSVADLDSTNLGFGGTQGQLVNNINAITPSGWTASYVPTAIKPTTAAYNALLTAYAGPSTDQAFQDAVSRLDYAAHQAGLSDGEIANIVGSNGTLTNAINNTGTASTFDRNTSAAFAAGYVLGEIPVTLGWPVRDWLAVGASLKLMVGKVAAAKARMESNADSLGSYMREAVKNGDRTVTGGLDLGIAVRGSWWQAGLSGRNLNRPVLKGGTFKDSDGQPFVLDDVPLEPQVAVGAALYPWTAFCLTGDLDLTENRTRYSTTSGRNDLAAGTDRTLTVEYKSRMLHAGAEWNILHTLALRGGYSRDLTDGGTPPKIHGGLGLNLWAMRIDLAGAIATEKVTVDDKEVPRAAEASLGLAVDF